MRKQYTFVWLDDSRTKVDAMTGVVESGVTDSEITSKVYFAEMTAEVFKNLEAVTSLIQEHSTNLIIVDHVINQGSLGAKGSSVAHLLRSIFPSLPIVCVSAAWGPTQTEMAFDQEDLSEYIRIFPYGSLAQDSELELLYAIARDFSRCVEAATTSDVETKIVELLGTPASEMQSLEKVLPSEFKVSELRTTPHRIARWILGMFIARPGYLYNEIRAATLLGLSLEGFAKVSEQFRDSKYTGVFATEADPRWWVVNLHEQLAKFVPEAGQSSTQRAGRQLAGISEADYSKCYSDDTCNPPPDSVAFLDGTSKVEVAGHASHTKIYAHDIGGVPGFEPRLVLGKRVSQNAT